MSSAQRRQHVRRRQVKAARHRRTRSPEDVASAVVSAIERNRGEVDVAPLPLRASTIFASVAPELAGSFARRLGSEDITRKLEAGQRGKR